MIDRILFKQQEGKTVEHIIMQRIIFKNINRRGSARKVVKELMQSVTDRSPSLKGCRVCVTLEMHNSSVPARPDFYTVKVYVSDGRYRGVRLEKTGINLFATLTEVIDCTIENFNRLNDRRAVNERDRKRKFTAVVESCGIRRKQFW